jgi:hypothetical protein
MTKVKSGNGLDPETVRKMYQVTQEKKHDQAQVDKEWKMVCDNGVKITKADYGTFIGIQEKMSFEEFSDFYLNGEMPAMKLDHKQMEILKAGSTIQQVIINQSANKENSTKGDTIWVAVIT